MFLMKGLLLLVNRGKIKYRDVVEVQKMKKKKVTIKEVAKLSEVSIATVSQILNGHEAKFNKQTVAKVFAAKEKLNYEPDYFARRMVIKNSKTIGVLVPDVTNPFFNTLIRGIERELYKAGFMTLLCNADLEEEKERSYLNELTRRGVDGFIIANSAISDQEINEHLRKKEKPFIIIDQKKAEGFSDAVVTDDFLGGQLAGMHFYELGHRDIAIVIPEHAPSNIQQRLFGLYSIFEANHIKVIHAPLTKQGGEEAVLSILTSQATAVLAANDEVAFGVYAGLLACGKKVPEDYSVIGYDNVEMCRYVTPQLTTVAQPIAKIGQLSAQLLIKRIEDPTKPWEEISLPVELIKRSSTAPLK